MLNRSASRLAWVPFPAPGAPISSRRIGQHIFRRDGAGGSFSIDKSSYVPRRQAIAHSSPSVALGYLAAGPEAGRNVARMEIPRVHTAFQSDRSYVSIVVSGTHIRARGLGRGAMPAVADAGQTGVASIIGLGATGVAGGVIAMAWSLHLHKLQLAGQLA